MNVASQRSALFRSLICLLKLAQNKRAGDFFHLHCEPGWLADQWRASSARRPIESAQEEGEVGKRASGTGRRLLRAHTARAL